MCKIILLMKLIASVHATVTNKRIIFMAFMVTVYFYICVYVLALK